MIVGEKTINLEKQKGQEVLSFQIIKIDMIYKPQIKIVYNHQIKNFLKEIFLKKINIKLNNQYWKRHRYKLMNKISLNRKQ